MGNRSSTPARDTRRAVIGWSVAAQLPSHRREADSDLGADAGAADVDVAEDEHEDRASAARDADAADADASMPDGVDAHGVVAGALGRGRRAALMALTLASDGIKTLHLSQQRLVAVSAELASPRFATLCVLTLDGNRLRDLPEGLATLPHLSRLSLARNLFSRLPDCVWAMPSLVQLNADHNRIASLDAPDPRTGFQRLMSLSLVDNQLDHVPHTLGAASRLIHLNLSANPIHALPCELGRLRFLQHLILDDCPLYARDAWTPAQAQADAERAVGDGAPRPVVPSLHELAARALLGLHGCAIPRTVATATISCVAATAAAAGAAAAAAAAAHRVPADIVRRLRDAQACSECGSPFLGPPLRRVRWSRRNGYDIPWVHDLCSDHWSDDASALRFRFQQAPAAPWGNARSDLQHGALLERVYNGAGTPSCAASSAQSPDLASRTPTMLAAVATNVVDATTIATASTPLSTSALDPEDGAASDDVPRPLSRSNARAPLALRRVASMPAFGRHLEHGGSAGGLTAAAAGGAVTTAATATATATAALTRSKAGGTGGPESGDGRPRYPSSRAAGRASFIAASTLDTPSLATSVQ